MDVDDNELKRIERIKAFYPDGRGDFNEARPYGEAFHTSLAMFREYRDYIKHEDENINTRVTWFISLNAFLFAAFALLVAEIGSVTKTGEFERYVQPTVAILISCVGIAISILTRISVNAAYRAIRRLRIHWCNHHEPLTTDFRDIPIFPHIVGGGPNSKTALKGRILATWMPIMTAFTWATALGGAITAIAVEIDSQTFHASKFFGYCGFLYLLLISTFLYVHNTEKEVEKELDNRSEGQS